MGGRNQDHAQDEKIIEEIQRTDIIFAIKMFYVSESEDRAKESDRRNHEYKKAEMKSSLNDKEKSAFGNVKL